MIMAAADLLARNPDPSEDEIREALAGQPLPLHGLPQHRQGRPRRAAEMRGAEVRSETPEEEPAWAHQA